MSLIAARRSCSACCRPARGASSSCSGRRDVTPTSAEPRALEAGGVAVGHERVRHGDPGRRGRDRDDRLQHARAAPNRLPTTAVRQAMTVTRARRALVVIVLAVIGGGSYALASTGSRSDTDAPKIECDGPTGQLLSVQGRVPSNVDAAYLAYVSGASIQANINHRTYAFLIPERTSARGLPSRLEYLDRTGHRHVTRLSEGSFPKCARASRRLQFNTPSLTSQPTPASQRTRRSSGVTPADKYST
jgi:hypothetical protein